MGAFGVSCPFWDDKAVTQKLAPSLGYTYWIAGFSCWAIQASPFQIMQMLTSPARKGSLGESELKSSTFGIKSLSSR